MFRVVFVFYDYGKILFAVLRKIRKRGKVKPRNRSSENRIAVFNVYYVCIIAYAGKNDRSGCVIIFGIGIPTVCRTRIQIYIRIRGNYEILPAGSNDFIEYGYFMSAYAQRGIGFVFDFPTVYRTIFGSVFCRAATSMNFLVRAVAVRFVSVSRFGMIFGILFAVLDVTRNANRLCRTGCRSTDGMVGFRVFSVTTRSLTLVPMLRFGSRPFGIPIVVESGFCLISSVSTTGTLTSYVFVPTGFGTSGSLSRVIF